MKKGGIKKFFKWFGIGLGIILIIGLICIGVLFGKQIVSKDTYKTLFIEKYFYRYICLKKTIKI